MCSRSSTFSAPSRAPDPREQPQMYSRPGPSTVHQAPHIMRRPEARETLRSGVKANPSVTQISRLGFPSVVLLLHALSTANLVDSAKPRISLPILPSLERYHYFVR
eukprot:GFKZ01013294.1.p1 GENE.GFKZ01013294.1~~GFKZ01013294.1.p1  ORF type:complete len:106 (+),score=3.71 GFKZ01013294.1:560-877(+)